MAPRTHPSQPILKWRPQPRRSRRLQKASPQTSVFPFLRLPAEIRTQIYHYALDTRQQPQLPLQLPAKQPLPTALTTLHTLSALNKQCHAEATHHFLQHTHIHWTAPLSDPRFAAFAKQTLLQVPTTTAAGLRILSLSVADYQLAWMATSSLRAFLLRIGSSSNSAGLRELRLVVRNDYVDLERDDEVWYHWKNVAEFNALEGTVAFPPMAGLAKLVVVAPWPIEDAWKNRLRTEIGGGCVVEFGNNYDATVAKPRKEMWEKRPVF